MMPVPTLDDPLPFYRIVWEIVKQIPSGLVSTYGQIASMIPAPEEVDPAEYAAFGGQIVGYAMNAVSSKDDPTIPWHRVINSKGGISLADTNPASAVQRGRLRAEGVEFDDRELVDLNDYGWEGPNAEWLAERGLLPPKSIKQPNRKKPRPKAKRLQDDTDEWTPDGTPPTQMNLL
ncbi:MAG: MGMT family protein [Anaerolineae bacterium]